MANVFDLETDLIQMGIDILPSLPINQKNINNISFFYEQIILSLFSKAYKSDLLFLSIIKMVNLVQRKQIKINHTTLLVIIETGFKSINYQRLWDRDYSKLE